MLEGLSNTPLDPNEKGKDVNNEESKKESYSGEQDMHDTDSAYETDNDGSEYDGVTKPHNKDMDTNPWGDEEE